VQVRRPANHPAAPPNVLLSAGPPAAALLAHRPLTAILVGIVVLFLVSLAAFLLYIFTLPSDRGGGG